MGREMKKSIKEIVELETKCKKCASKFIFKIDDEKRAFRSCPVCGAHLFSGADDPVIMLNDVLKIFKRANDAEFSFICEDEKESK